MLKSEAGIGQVQLLSAVTVARRDIRTNRNGCVNRIALRRVATALSKARFASGTRPKTYTTSWNNPSVPIPEGRHSVVRRRFRLFIQSDPHGTMRPWLTLANHTNTIRRMEQCQEGAPTRTRATIRLTPVLSVLRRQLTGSGRHLTCSVSVALRSTQRSNEVTSNALSSARRRCFTLPTLPRF